MKNVDLRNASCRELESGLGCTSDPVSTRATTRRSWRGEATRGCALTMRTPPRWGQNRSFYRVDPAAASTPETAARRATAKQLCVGVVGKLCILVCACRTEKGRKGASSATTPTLRHSDNTTQHNPARSGLVARRAQGQPDDHGPREAARRRSRSDPRHRCSRVLERGGRCRQRAGFGVRRPGEN